MKCGQMIVPQDTYVTEGPELYTGESAEYVWALCQCELPADYAIKIPTEGRFGVFLPFKCKRCGTTGEIYVGPPQRR